MLGEERMSLVLYTAKNLSATDDLHDVSHFLSQKHVYSQLITGLFIFNIYTTFLYYYFPLYIALGREKMRQWGPTDSLIFFQFQVQFLGPVYLSTLTS